MNIAQALDAAPPTPACFHDRLAWSEYLLSAQRYTNARVLPFANGIYQPEFSFCRDCTRSHKTEMWLDGKCNPNKFLTHIRVKEMA